MIASWAENSPKGYLVYKRGFVKTRRKLEVDTKPVKFYKEMYDMYSIVTLSHNLFGKSLKRKFVQIL